MNAQCSNIIKIKWVGLINAYVISLGSIECEGAPGPIVRQRCMPDNARAFIVRKRERLWVYTEVSAPGLAVGQRLRFDNAQASVVRYYNQ